MARLTQRLPVGPVPEQLLISTVGCDVVHNGRFRVSALLHALNAQRVALKEPLGFRLPSAAVSSFTRRPSNLWMEWQMFIAVLFTGFHQSGASGMLAGNFRFVRHPDYLHVGGSSDPT